MATDRSGGPAVTRRLSSRDGGAGLWESAVLADDLDSGDRSRPRCPGAGRGQPGSHGRGLGWAKAGEMPSTDTGSQEVARPVRTQEEWGPHTRTRPQCSEFAPKQSQSHLTRSGPGQGAGGGGEQKPLAAADPSGDSILWPQLTVRRWVLQLDQPEASTSSGQGCSGSGFPRRWRG